MRIKDKTITNRSEFIKHFSLKELWNKIDEVCDFFENSVDSETENEKMMRELLEGEGNPQVDFGIFRYADAEYYTKDYGLMTDSNKKTVVRLLALLELGRCTKKEDISVFLSGTNSGRMPCTGSIPAKKLPVNTVVDVSEHMGLEFEKYLPGEDAAVSEKNPVYTVTYVNNSTDRNSWINIKIYNRLNPKAGFMRIFAGEALTGAFIGGKLVGFYPVTDSGLSHFVTRGSDGTYSYNTFNNGIIRKYPITGDNYFYFSATNDGIVLLSDRGKIEYFSDSQLPFRLALEKGEAPVMICAREQVCVVLTNFGRLLTNEGEECSGGVIYVVMRESGIWYALTSENKIISNMPHKRVTEVKALSDIEEIVFGAAESAVAARTAGSKLGVENPHFAIYGRYTVIKAGSCIEILPQDSEGFSYQI